MTVIRQWRGGRCNQFDYFTENILRTEGDTAPGQTSLSLVWPVISSDHSLQSAGSWEDKQHPLRNKGPSNLEIKDIWKRGLSHYVTCGTHHVLLQLHDLMQKFLLGLSQSKHEHPNVANRCDKSSTVQGMLI